MKKLLAILIILISFSLVAGAQTHETIRVERNYANVVDIDDSNSVYTTAQQMPKYNGDMYKLVQDSLNWPPMEDAFIGTVYVTFIVEKNGTISNIQVLRGIKGAPLMNKEAVRVVSLLKSWTPGMQNGKPVRVRCNVPIRFKRQ